MSEASPTLRARLGRTLAVAAHALPNVFDESTDYFDGFSAELSKSVTLTPGAFKAALAVGAAYHVDFLPGEDFFDRARACGEPQSSAFNLLEKLMHACLTELTVAFARKEGAVRVRLWLFGRLDGADLVGLKTEATEP